MVARPRSHTGPKAPAKARVKEKGRLGGRVVAKEKAPTIGRQPRKHTTKWWGGWGLLALLFLGQGSGPARVLEAVLMKKTHPSPPRACCVGYHGLTETDQFLGRLWQPKSARRLVCLRKPMVAHTARTWGTGVGFLHEYNLQDPCRPIHLAEEE